MRLAVLSILQLVAICIVACRESPFLATKGSSARQMAARQSAVCSPLPAAPGNMIRVAPAQAGDLARIVSSAPSGSVILLADGVYAVSEGLVFQRPEVTMRSLAAQQGQSSDPDRVIIDGMNGSSGQTGGDDTRVPELVGISASHVTISDLTLRNARDHLIHAQTAGQDIQNTKIYNLRLIDPGQQAIKINTTPGSGSYTDWGEVACSFLELTDA